MRMAMASKILGPSTGLRLTQAYVYILLYFLISPSFDYPYGGGCYGAAAFVMIDPMPTFFSRPATVRQRQLQKDIARLSLSSTASWSSKTPFSSKRISTSRKIQSFSSSSFRATNDDDFDDLSRFSAVDRPEGSQMPNYVVNYLRKTNINNPQPSDGETSQGSNNLPSSSQSFLIAIPLDQCHELGLELESVQRAILYHCPILVHACLPQAILKVPLLFVTAITPTGTSTTPQQILTQLVQAVVQEVLYKTEEEDAADEGSNVASESRLDAVQRDDGSPDSSGRNKDGYQPLLIPFQTLEIDGINNQILYTIGDPQAHGTKTLQTFLRVLQDRIARDHPTWTIQLPHDPQQAKNQHTSSASFRPRVPFVRLPKNWDEYLPKPKEDASEEDFFFLTSDEGGNGISPIFWGQWMDDAFGEAARMPEIGIYNYQQKQQQDQSQSSTRDSRDDHDDDRASTLSIFDFHDWPESIIPLPTGNDALTQVERRFEQYQQDRLQQAYERERQLAMTKDQGSASLDQDEDGSEDPLFRKTLNRLESLYQPNLSPEEMDQPKAYDSSSGNGPGEAVSNASPMTASSAQPNSLGESEDRIRSESSEPSDNWMTERIRQVVESRAKVQTEQQLSNPQRRKEKVPLEDNPVFAKYKNGTLTPKSQQSNPPSSNRQLPPFPSREHCVGFWRVLSSPTGFEVEEGNPSRSDNLVLRVDGTTAGGPILDQVTRQKASAGTWKFNPPSIHDDDDNKGNRLRIRLVIPPQKERVLVLRGTLERITSALPSTMDFTLAPRGTFGIPELEERASRATADMEELLYCSGTVCMEDAVTGHNREEIGTFSLLKLNTPTDPSQYTITIPKSVRNQD